MKGWWTAVIAIVVLLGAGLYVRSMRNKTPGAIATTPTPAAAVQLAEDKQPKLSLTFTKDAHEVTVSFTNLNADKLEYNLIYEATIKSGGKTTRTETGVYGEETVTGKQTYSSKQLLGSESSGKRTYHEGITNARLELTLRDAQGRSVFTSTYPFDVKGGASVDLVPAE